MKKSLLFLFVMPAFFVGTVFAATQLKNFNPKPDYCVVTLRNMTPSSVMVYDIVKNQPVFIPQEGTQVVRFSSVNGLKVIGKKIEKKTSSAFSNYVLYTPKLETCAREGAMKSVKKLPDDFNVHMETNFCHSDQVPTFMSNGTIGCTQKSSK